MPEEEIKQVQEQLDRLYQEIKNTKNFNKEFLINYLDSLGKNPYRSDGFNIAQKCAFSYAIDEAIHSIKTAVNTEELAQKPEVKPEQTPTAPNTIPELQEKPQPENNYQNLPEPSIPSVPLSPSAPTLPIKENENKNKKHNKTSPFKYENGKLIIKSSPVNTKSKFLEGDIPSESSPTFMLEFDLERNKPEEKPDEKSKQTAPDYLKIIRQNFDREDIFDGKNCLTSLQLDDIKLAGDQQSTKVFASDKLKLNIKILG